MRKSTALECGAFSLATLWQQRPPFRESLISEASSSFSYHLRVLALPEMDVSFVKKIPFFG
jgi:hypothetical protein